VSATFPGASVPAVGQGGFFTYPWLTWLQQFGSQPGGIAAIPVGPSPFSYTSSGAGAINVVGGTVSSVTLNRAGTIVQANTPVFVANNDVVTVIYSAPPSMSFVPG